MRYLLLILALLLIATSAFAGDCCQPAACASAVSAAVTVEVPAVAVVRPAPLVRVATAVGRARVDVSVGRPWLANRARHVERHVVRDKR